MLGAIIILEILSILLINNAMKVFISQYYSGKRIIIYCIQSVKSFSLKRITLCQFLSIIISLYLGFFSFKVALCIFGISNIIICFFKMKKFPITRRSLMLFTMSSIISVVSGLLCYFSNLSQLVFLYCLIILIPHFFIIIGNTLLYPNEEVIRLFYIKSAKKKIQMNPKLKIIGITGSFGKTSLKNYLYALMSEKYLVVKSPGSVNTRMGICKFINESLSPYDEIMILEYGVDTKNGMNKLLKVCRPHIAVITAIGEMHLATFKSINNIKNEKLKLAYNSIDKVVFYNKDSLLSSQDFASLEAYPYSGESLKDFKVSLEGTTCQYDDLKIKSRLYGRLQLLNLVGAVEIAKYFHISNDKLARGISKIRPVQHRLSLEKRGRIYVLDDSYNGNFQGIIEGIKILKELKGKKGIITPGVIEIGDKYYDTNYAIGKELVGIDVVYLVGNDPSPLKDGYLANGGDEKKLRIGDSFSISYHKLSKERVRIILIANDTPENYIK